MPLLDRYVPAVNAEKGQYAGEFSSDGFRRTFRPELYRPYFDKYDRPCIVANTGQYTIERGQRVPIRRKITIAEYAQRTGRFLPVWNATSLRKEDWIQLDRAVVPAARDRMRAFNDLAASNTYSGFDAYSKTTVEYEAMSDPGEAVVDMFGDTPGRTDEHRFILRSTPLPITHSDFNFQDRRIAISGGFLDTAMAEAAGRRVGETVERTTIGTEEGIEFGTQTAGYGTHTGESKVYGWTNFPDRITKTDLTAPTGTNPEAVMTDLLEMVELLETAGYYGPYRLYHSTGYSRYFNDDYFRTGSTSAVRTVRERLQQIEGISSISRLDFLTSGYQLILADMTRGNPTAPRAIVGMPVTTIQWPAMGGLVMNFKVMAILVSQFRSDFNSTCGIVHGTTV